MLKKNSTLFVIFFYVLVMYLGVMISMFNPKDMTSITDMLKLFPEDMMKALGFSGMVTDLTGYLASWLYGLLMLGLPMVYCIILANRLVAKPVDNGSFAYILSTPNSRTKIIITQGIYALASVALLFALIFGVGVAVCAIVFPGTLDVGAFLSLNITTMLVNMTVMMISFFFSCVCGSAKMSMGFGAGIPIMFLLMNMLGGVSQNIDILKRVSIYGFYDPLKLVKGADILGTDLIYIGISAVLFISAALIFKKKRLAL